jgi:hypothetical protein
MSDVTQFREQLDTLGADLARWPLEPRAAASALLASSAEARAALAAARRLDEQLVRASGGLAGPDLRARILAIPREQPRRPGQPSGAAWLAVPWRIGMAAAAASLLLGVALGRSDLIPLEEAESAYDVAALAYGPAPVIGELP